MTPATRLLDQHAVDYRLHSYQHTAANSDYGIDASAQLGVPADRVFKTLVAELDSHELVVAIVPVSGRLHMKSLANAAGAKKAFMAERTKVEKTTGYVLGGVSPLGQKKALATFIDASAHAFETIFISGGRRGLEIELAPDDLAKLTGGRFAALGEHA
ncbi:ybak/ebsc protein [Salinisphaera dokdonensis CL-ES53]|uniref:Cys-tRNA(Pro)/Cys-tRNA(Cys) deacylase n=1 Tax=Salinisphaera dokdonensis CL-ES53 TaxID=1304272 RepID=A0ABV2AYH5_9GAMM